MQNSTDSRRSNVFLLKFKQYIVADFSEIRASQSAGSGQLAGPNIPLGCGYVAWHAGRAGRCSVGQTAPGYGGNKGRALQGGKSASHSY